MADYEHGHSAFIDLLRKLIGETVRIQTNDSAFRGRLAEVASTFVTLASRSSVGQSAVNLVFIPVRHINAVTER